jgi:hypothetical protein
VESFHLDRHPVGSSGERSSNEIADHRIYLGLVDDGLGAERPRAEFSASRLDRSPRGEHVFAGMTVDERFDRELDT